MLNLSSSISRRSSAGTFSSMWSPALSPFFVLLRPATKKAVGSTKNGRDSAPKFLGVKTFGSEFVKPGNILVRQRGTRFLAGTNVYLGKDHTLHANVYGYVRFAPGKLRRDKTFVHVDPIDVDPSVVQQLSQKQ